MIRHIVMWKLDETYSATEKKDILNEFKAKLLFLDGKISELKQISAGLNSEAAPAGNFDIILETAFNSFDDLKAYAIHPEHQKVIEFVKTLKLQRSCVDYEY